MSINQKVQDLLFSIRGDEEEIFPYLSNKNWAKGKPIYYAGPYWDEKEVGAAITSLLNGKWLSAGSNVNQFEKNFSKKFGFKNSLMVNSGSSANLVMLAALKDYYNWSDGDEIIVCACGFPTTINPILQNNLKPVFVDIDFTDLNWSLNDLEEKITYKTRAVFSSPVLGNTYNIDDLMNIIENKEILYIADNCDSLGSKWKDDYLTKNAVAASCSFYPAHHITTIEGGMVSSNNEDLIKLARSYAWWGRACYCVGEQNYLANGVCGKRFSKWIEGYDNDIDHKYLFSVKGYNLKPIDMLGAIGLVQLEKFDEIHLKRRQNKLKISELFNRINGLRVVDELEAAETSWFGVPIIFEGKTQTRNKATLVKHLESRGVQTRNYFAGNILMHPAYNDIDNPRNYPNALKVLDDVFFVGCSPVITSEMIDYIQEVLLEFN